MTPDPGAAAGDIVQVWLIRTDLPAVVLADLETLLDDDERQRAAMLVLASHRHRFIAAHGAFRVIIGHHLGAPPAQLRWCRGPHGKPELAGAWTGAQVSLSHSGGLAALALSRRSVGVDIQQLPAELDVTRMSDRFYPPQDARYVAAAAEPAARVDRFIRLWTRKEACVKVAGGRLFPGLKLPVSGTDPILVHDPGGSPPGPYLVHDVPVPDGFYASVAMAGPLPYRVRCGWWPGDELSPAVGSAPVASSTPVTGDRASI